jgi:hypothetical protein
VRLLGASEIWRHGGASVFVIAGANRPIDLEDVRATLAAAGQPRVRTIAQPEQELRARREGAADRPDRRVRACRQPDQRPVQQPRLVALGSEHRLPDLDRVEDDQGGDDRDRKLAECSAPAC